MGVGRLDVASSSLLTSAKHEIKMVFWYVVGIYAVIPNTRVAKDSVISSFDISVLALRLVIGHLTLSFNF